MKVMRKLQGKAPDRRFAKALGISPQYLCDIYKGRREPGPAVASALGFTSTNLYVEQTSCGEAQRLVKEKLHEDSD